MVVEKTGSLNRKIAAVDARDAVYSTDPSENVKESSDGRTDRPASNVGALSYENTHMNAMAEGPDK